MLMSPMSRKLGERADVVDHFLSLHLGMGISACVLALSIGLSGCGYSVVATEKLQHIDVEGMSMEAF